MQWPAPDLPFGIVPGAPRSNVKDFLWSSPIFGRKMLRKFPKCYGHREITWLVGVIIHRRSQGAGFSIAMLPMTKIWRKILTFLQFQFFQHFSLSTVINNNIDDQGQGRREPNVGPGPAQIWRISGFVNSKTDGENAAVLSELGCDLQKKKRSTEIRWSPKKKRSSPKF